MGRVPDYDETLPLFPGLERKRERQRVWVQRKRAANPKPNTGSNTPAHRRVYAQREAAAIAKCDRLIAEQVRRETPPIRRCEICLGVELVASPHDHGGASAKSAAA